MKRHLLQRVLRRKPNRAASSHGEGVTFIHDPTLYTDEELMTAVALYHVLDSAALFVLVTPEARIA